MSENVTATMLIPSNEVINDALTTARQKLTEWGLEREDSIIRNWVFQAAFFNKKYTKLDFEENEDLKSVFSKQWRTTVQEVDLDHPVNMSNGTAYYVKKMKIPTNVLIYRLKDHFYYYEKMTALEKETSKRQIWHIRKLDIAMVKVIMTDGLQWDFLESIITLWCMIWQILQTKLIRLNLHHSSIKKWELQSMRFHLIRFRKEHIRFISDLNRTKVVKLDR